MEKMTNWFASCGTFHMVYTKLINKSSIYAEHTPLLTCSLLWQGGIKLYYWSVYQHVNRMSSSILWSGNTVTSTYCSCRVYQYILWCIMLPIRLPTLHPPLPLHEWGRLPPQSFHDELLGGGRCCNHRPREWGKGDNSGPGTEQH